MNVEDFRRILTSFADTPADVDLGKSSLLVQVHDEMIEAKITVREGDVIVTENEAELPAAKWLVRRVAKLPLLAERIVNHVADEPTFVSPDGYLLDQIDQSPTEDDVYVNNAPETVITLLNRRPAGAASVLYLTSDAGEGKTTVISHVARKQAQLYKEKKTDWLLVPVSLGGRTFMRFDDVIVGTLRAFGKNHFRDSEISGRS